MKLDPNLLERVYPHELQPAHPYMYLGNGSAIPVTFQERRLVNQGMRGEENLNIFALQMPAIIIPKNGGERRLLEAGTECYANSFYRGWGEMPEDFALDPEAEPIEFENGWLLTVES